MIFLFILFFDTNFALSNELINNYKNENNDPEKLQIKTQINNNNTFSEIVTLKNIPKTKVSYSEKKELRTRNPFSPPGSETQNSKSGINFSDIRFKGIAKIGENKVAFLETSKGTNAYEVNQNIGGGYKILNINEKDLLVEISNQSATYTLKLEKDEK
tara:strand:+ start:680 stop:1153 length:474 start_codon:yes stop_codon:yes gene_type:complete